MTTVHDVTPNFYYFSDRKQGRMDKKPGLGSSYLTISRDKAD